MTAPGIRQRRPTRRGSDTDSPGIDKGFARRGPRWALPRERNRSPYAWVLSIAGGNG
jgi:hypothetical protein